MVDSGEITTIKKHISNGMCFLRENGFRMEDHLLHEVAAV